MKLLYFFTFINLDQLGDNVKLHCHIDLEVNPTDLKSLHLYEYLCLLNNSNNTNRKS